MTQPCTPAAETPYMLVYQPAGDVRRELEKFSAAEAPRTDQTPLFSRAQIRPASRTFGGLAPDLAVIAPAPRQALTTNPNQPRESPWSGRQGLFGYTSQLHSVQETTPLARPCGDLSKTGLVSR